MSEPRSMSLLKSVSPSLKQFNKVIDNETPWGYLVTMVSDLGTGVTEAKCQNLFTTFQSGENGVFSQKSLDSSGIGLGLTTAKNLANALGGEVLLKSKKGQGTDVVFSVQMRNKACELS